MATQLRNVFLGTKPRHNVLLDGCFCNDCRLRRCGRYGALDNRRLYNMFIAGLPRIEHNRLMKCHETVLNMIVAGRVYKESCLQGTGYEQLKSWANVQDQFADWDPIVLKEDHNVHIFANF